jgi:hypothetical protein
MAGIHRGAALPALLSLFLLAGPGPVRAGDDPPKTPAQALERARPLLDNAAALAPFVDKEAKVFLDMAAGLRKAFEFLRAQGKEGFDRTEYAGAWNEAVSLARYHGMTAVPEYRMVRESVPDSGIWLAVPEGRGWTVESMTSRADATLAGRVQRVLPDGRIVRSVRVHRYELGCTYGDVTGDNPRGLAQARLAVEAADLARVQSRSDQVAVERLGKGFPRTHFFEIAGEVSQGAPVRLRGYFAKGTRATFSFLAFEFRRFAEADPPWVRWQVEGPDPELAAVLESFTEPPR